MQRWENFYPLLIAKDRSISDMQSIPIIVAEKITVICLFRGESKLLVV